MSTIQKIKSIIIDDEDKSRSVLKALLTSYCPEIEVIGEADNGQDGYIMATQLMPNLVFLDIQMPVENGFAFLKRFDKVPFDIIFVTSYDKYALTAIKFSAIDYLLKPIETKELIEAVKKVKDKQSVIDKKFQVVNLLNNLTDSIDKRIAVQKNEKVVLIKLKDVVCIEGANRYSYIHTIDKEKFIITKTIKEFEEFLGHLPNFLRISKSAIVNSEYIVEYTKGEVPVLLLQNGLRFDISKRKKAEINEKLKF